MFRPLLPWRARLFSVVLCSLGSAHGLTSVDLPHPELPRSTEAGSLPVSRPTDSSPSISPKSPSPEPSPTLSAAAKALRDSSASFSRVVWMFYDTPIEQADPISRVCVSGWKLAIEKYNNKLDTEDERWQLLILSNESVNEYLHAEELQFLNGTKSFSRRPEDGGLPKDIKGKNTWHSDLLRLRLIEIYGGMWVDVSTFPFQIAEFGWIEKLLFEADVENAFGPYDVIMRADNNGPHNDEFGNWRPEAKASSGFEKSGFEKARAKWPVPVNLQKGERVAPIPENSLIIAKRGAPLIVAWRRRTEVFMLSLLKEWERHGNGYGGRPIDIQQPEYAKELYGEKKNLLGLCYDTVRMVVVSCLKKGDGDKKKWKSQTPGKGLDNYQYLMAYFAFHAVMLDKYAELLALAQHSTSSSPGPAVLEQADFNPARAFSLLVLPTTGALPDHVRTTPALKHTSPDVKKILEKENKSLSEIATERVAKALGEFVLDKIPQEFPGAAANNDALGVGRAVSFGNLEAFCSMGVAEALGRLSDAEDRMIMTAWREQFYHRSGLAKYNGEVREILSVIFGARMFGPLSGKGRDGEYSSTHEEAVLAEFNSKEEWESFFALHLEKKWNKYVETASPHLPSRSFVGLFATSTSSTTHEDKNGINELSGTTKSGIKPDHEQTSSV